MTEVERIYDPVARLKGRAAALHDVKHAVRSGRSYIYRLCVAYADGRRYEVEQKVFKDTCAKAENEGIDIDKHVLRSFIAGYSDTIMAVALLRGLR